MSAPSPTLPRPALAPLALALAGAAAVWASSRARAPAIFGGVVCSVAAAEPRPRPSVTTVRSEPLAGAPGKRVTVQLVRLPPLALTPPHVHGGDVVAYVTKGEVRSAHAGLPAADFRAGDSFHEPVGTTHALFENLSATEEAEVLAVTVHDEGAALTTFL